MRERGEKIPACTGQRVDLERRSPSTLGLHPYRCCEAHEACDGGIAALPSSALLWAVGPFGFQQSPETTQTAAGGCNQEERCLGMVFQHASLPFASIKELLPFTVLKPDE